MPNPALNEKNWKKAASEDEVGWAAGGAGAVDATATTYHPPIDDGPISPLRTGVMTMGGAMSATGVLFVVLLATAVIGWNSVETGVEGSVGSVDFPGLASAPALRRDGRGLPHDLQAEVGACHRSALRRPRGSRARSDLARLRRAVERHRRPGDPAHRGSVRRHALHVRDTHHQGHRPDAPHDHRRDVRRGRRLRRFAHRQPLRSRDLVHQRGELRSRSCSACSSSASRRSTSCSTSTSSSEERRPGCRSTWSGTRGSASWSHSCGCTSRSCGCSASSAQLSKLRSN